MIPEGVVTGLNGHFMPGMSWKLRALQATQGNQSRLGCILIAMLGRMPQNPPRIRGLAIITGDKFKANGRSIPPGIVIADMELRNGKGFCATPLGTIDEIRDNFRGLADMLKLNDADRTAMFNELRMWIKRDYRAVSDL